MSRCLRQMRRVENKCCFFRWCIHSLLFSLISFGIQILGAAAAAAENAGLKPGSVPGPLNVRRTAAGGGTFVFPLHTLPHTFFLDFSPNTPASLPFRIEADLLRRSFATFDTTSDRSRLQHVHPAATRASSRRKLFAPTPIASSSTTTEDNALSGPSMAMACKRTQR